MSTKLPIIILIQTIAGVFRQTSRLSEFKSNTHRFILPIKWGSSGLVCISTNSNRVLVQRFLFLQLWEINGVSVVYVHPYTEFVRNVWFEKFIY